MKGQVVPNLLLFLRALFVNAADYLLLGVSMALLAWNVADTLVGRWGTLAGQIYDLSIPTPTLLTLLSVLLATIVAANSGSRKGVVSLLKSTTWSGKEELEVVAEEKLLKSTTWSGKEEPEVVAEEKLIRTLGKPGVSKALKKLLKEPSSKSAEAKLIEKVNEMSERLSSLNRLTSC